jgi:hypothetical protein
MRLKINAPTANEYFGLKALKLIQPDGNASGKESVNGKIRPERAD